MRNFIVAVAVIVTVRVAANLALNAIAKKCFETQAPNTPS
jgi:hypothetical protein